MESSYGFVLQKKIKGLGVGSYFQAPSVGKDLIYAEKTWEVLPCGENVGCMDLYGKQGKYVIYTAIVGWLSN